MMISAFLAVALLSYANQIAFGAANINGNGKIRYANGDAQSPPLDPTAARVQLEHNRQTSQQTPVCHSRG